MGSTKEIFEKIRDLNPNERNILATVIEGNNLGRKMLLSGGKVVFSDLPAEIKVRDKEKIEAALESSRISCDDAVYFCELLGGEKKLVICGGGHISIPLIQMGKMTGFHVTVIEDRPSFADNTRKAGADVVICEDFSLALKRLKSDRDTFFVIVTRGHRYDMVCLQEVIQKENGYIGMIGSKARVKNVLDTVEENLKNILAPKQLEKVYAPIGLKIKAETAEEISISIMAEIIQVKNENFRSEGYSKEVLKEILTGNQGMVLATIISRKGSAPRGIGTKMLIYQDGTIMGTIGGGCGEAQVRQEGILCMKGNSPVVYKVDMTGQEAEEGGMVCGGVIEVLLEPVFC